MCESHCSALCVDEEEVTVDAELQKNERLTPQLEGFSKQTFTKTPCN